MNIKNMIETDLVCYETLDFEKLNIKINKTKLDSIFMSILSIGIGNNNVQWPKSIHNIHERLIELRNNQSSKRFLPISKIDRNHIGSTCDIFYCVYFDNNTLKFAVGKYFPLNQRLYFQNEMEMYKYIVKKNKLNKNSKYLINFLDGETINNNCIIYTQYKNNFKTFKKYFKNNKITQSDIINKILHLCMGVKYLHYLKIYHGDLKTSNLLLFENNENIISNSSDTNTVHTILLDFGFSILMDDNDMINKEILGCSPNYASPEVINNYKLIENKSIDKFLSNFTIINPFNGKQADIYSIGKIINKFLKKSIEKEIMDKNNTIYRELLNLKDECCNLENEKRIKLDDLVKNLQDIQIKNLLN